MVNGLDVIGLGWKTYTSPLLLTNSISFSLDRSIYKLVYSMVNPCLLQRQHEWGPPTLTVWFFEKIYLKNKIK